MSAELHVYLYAAPVGRLWLDVRRRFVFQYDPVWLTQHAAVPLSLSLPLRAEPYEDDQARPFFANLLPEAEVRRAVARRLGISEQNDFAMLEAIGGECAGAVSLLPACTSLPTRGDFRRLSEEALQQLIGQLPQRPLLAGDAEIRLSLAGAQNKLPVAIHNNEVSLPLGANPSTHILKPPIPGLAGTVENEAFCMQLAGRAGLSVPQVAIRQGLMTLYQIERYDREVDAHQQVQRIHQEDFCQALGVVPDQKYEKEGGPCLSDCFSLVRQHSVQPLPDVKALLQWVIFNYLIGNADAHAKNLAFLIPEDGPRLAPFYDLMCTAVYPGITDRLAMKIGGEDRPGWVIARKWVAFAQDVGIKSNVVRHTLLTMAEQLPAQALQLKERFYQHYGENDILRAICEHIQARCQKVQQAFKATE